MEKPWDVDLSIYEDERELLRGLRRRDRLACTCLLKFYAPRLLRLAGQLMGDPDEAEDVLQEAFIRACDQIDGFRGESGLGTWQSLAGKSPEPRWVCRFGAVPPRMSAHRSKHL